MLKPSRLLLLLNPKQVCTAASNYAPPPATATAQLARIGTHDKLPPPQSLCHEPRKPWPALCVSCQEKDVPIWHHSLAVTITGCYHDSSDPNRGYDNCDQRPHNSDHDDGRYCDSSRCFDHDTFRHLQTLRLFASKVREDLGQLG